MRFASRPARQLARRKSKAFPGCEGSVQAGQPVQNKAKRKRHNSAGERHGPSDEKGPAAFDQNDSIAHVRSRWLRTARAEHLEQGPNSSFFIHASALEKSRHSDSQPSEIPHTRAFSSEVDTGSRQENALKQRSVLSDSAESESTLAK